MKLCTETIIVHLPGKMDADGCDTYKDVTLDGVSWHKEHISSVTENGLKSANKITIRIPAAVLPTEFAIAKGVKITHGKDSVTVLSWTENCRGRAPHLKVVCA